MECKWAMGRSLPLPIMQISTENAQLTQLAGAAELT